MSKRELKRNKMRIFSTVGLVLGAVATVWGLYDFFSSVGADQKPTLFWLLFLGMPVLFVSVFFFVASFHVEITHYTTKGATAAWEELSANLRSSAASLSNATKKVLCKCPACQELNEELYAFCKRCGAHLHPTCAACGKRVPTDAKFCPHCGKETE